MKKLIAVLVVTILMVGCGQENEMLIEKNQLGKINKNTSVAELDKMFKNDSIEKFTADTELIREYRIFDKDGKQSLVFVTLRKNDSIKGMELVKIYSDKFTTEKGISTSSTFGEISGNYTINKIEPSFSAAILFIDEINATVSLDKKDLNLDEFDMSPIRQGQIPDEASVNYITLWFE